MKNSIICKILVCSLSMVFPWGMSAQKVSDKQPWSVRMAESEMIRCPESWQLDFQPKLKWDYCHGLELQSMLDVTTVTVTASSTITPWPMPTRW